MYSPNATLHGADASLVSHRSGSIHGIPLILFKSWNCLINGFYGLGRSTSHRQPAHMQRAIFAGKLPEYHSPPPWIYYFQAIKKRPKPLLDYTYFQMCLW
jgi:hypothetical protein